ncbi:hypothetical protein LTR37_004995 [Vermiconidia calcicola]|uniref:Uncharacterized protein n=1 Tax=Vermiconidia calcicola TaxID=1690605 RepID=A0ACC3NKU9_9PEZI|nr:hypothetical protein LTR37_004995 [Vermiconidia calcicola]
MDSGQQSPHSGQAGLNVPHDIFQPLLMIAQCGYEPRDIKEWYRTMLRHLRRMGPKNADAAYNLASLMPTTNTLLPEISEDDALNTTSGSQEDHVSPMAVPCGWTSSPSYESSFSFDPSYTRGNRLHVGPTPQPLYDDIDECYGTQLQPPSSPGQQQLLDSSDDRSRAISSGSIVVSNPATTRHSPLDASRLAPTFEDLLCSHGSQSPDPSEEQSAVTVTIGSAGLYGSLGSISIGNEQHGYAIAGATRSTASATELSHWLNGSPGIFLYRTRPVTARHWSLCITLLFNDRCDTL